MFLVYIACSLIPVLCFALYSYLQVRNQLEADAIGGIGREAKNAGMSIYERLRIAESQLRAIAYDSTIREEVRSESASALTHVRLEGLADLDLGPDERRQLGEPGAILLRFASDAGTMRPLLYLNTPEGILAGEVDADFLFTPERRELGDRYWVTNEVGDLLFAGDDDQMTRLIVPQRVRREVRTALDLEGPDGREIAIIWPLFLEVPFEAGTIYIGLSRSLGQIHRPLLEFERSFPIVVLLALVTALALALREIRRTWVPLDSLTEAALSISTGTFRGVDLKSEDEFGELAKAFNGMAEKIGNQIDALERLHEIGIALSSEDRLESLLDKIVQGAAVLSGAQACALFLLVERKGSGEEVLEVARVWLERASETSLADAKSNFPAGEASRATESGDYIRVVDAMQSEYSSSDEWNRFCPPGFAAIHSLLAVPMRNSTGQTLGALVVLRDSNQNQNFADEELQLVLSMASQAAVGIRQACSVESLRGLFEGLIQLTVRAIDEKSPHTGDHCRKVPIITELIAEAANKVDHGPLKNFSLSPEERYELRIAALLHDCGKMVTPVHIMDKATKLEGIIDRLELIRLRGEIILRDGLLKARGHWSKDIADSAQQLEKDLLFIGRCNIGGEFMPEEDKERIREIQQRHKWLDSSNSEFSLLSDEDVLNLCISRGTLNEEEREIINVHVVTTIRLLEELPFPKELRNVPAIAGSHHECVNGHGYPRQLRGKELSMRGRILCLADVFEALTAKDRPYKPGMSMSESLAILDRMVSEGALDPDLYDIFLEDKIYLHYAAKHMDLAQVDGEHRAELELVTAPWNS